MKTMADELAFLRNVTSHLPEDWSDEQRDIYIQHVLAQWRKHQEHSRDEEELLNKYLSTIKQHFKSQSPELYDFNQWPINENLLNMIKRDSLDPEIVKQVRQNIIQKSRKSVTFLLCRLNHQVYIHFLFFRNHFVSYSSMKLLISSNGVLTTDWNYIVLIQWINTVLFSITSGLMNV